MDAVTLWRWIGFFGMLLGVLYFYTQTLRPTNEYTKQSLVGLFAVPLIAMALYLMLALGQGEVTLDGRPVAWIRYVTWGLTTPLLLSQIARSVHAPPSLTLSLVLSDVFMIGTGAIAELSSKPTNYIWYAVSCLGFLAVLALLYRDLTVKAQGRPEDQRRLFTTLRDMNAALWIGYPVVWILGTAGFALIGQGAQAALYTILDLLAKVGFGLIILARRPVLERIGQDAAQQMPNQGRMN